MINSHSGIIILGGILNTHREAQGFPDGPEVKNLPETQETQVWFLGQKDPLEKEIATHSSILAWKIPRTEEPGGLKSMGSQRIGHNWVTNHAHVYRNYFFCFIGSNPYLCGGVKISPFCCLICLSSLVVISWAHRNKFFIEFAGLTESSGHSGGWTGWIFKATHLAATSASWFPSASTVPHLKCSVVFIIAVLAVVSWLIHLTINPLSCSPWGHKVLDTTERLNWTDRD